MSTEICDKPAVPTWAMAFPALASIDDARWRQMLHQAKIHRCRRGTSVLRDAACQANFLVVVRGHLRVLTHSAAGREVLLYRVAPGGVCLFNVFSRLLGHAIAPATAHAEDDLEIAVIDGAQFQEALYRSRELAHYIFGLIAAQAENLVRLVGNIAFQRLDIRLAALLVELSRDGNSGLTITQGELAARLGSPREVIGRALKEFEGRGWLQRRRGALTLLNPLALRHFSSMPAALAEKTLANLAEKTLTKRSTK